MKPWSVTRTSCIKIVKGFLLSGLRFGVLDLTSLFLWVFVFATTLAASCLFAWFEGRPRACLTQGQFCSRWNLRKNMIRYDPFPVSCQKDSTWKVATDERTYLLEFHLKFPGMNLLRVLVDTFSTKPKARKSFHQTSHSTVLCHGVDRLFSRRRYDYPWAKTKNRGKKDNWQKPWRHDRLRQQFTK